MKHVITTKRIYDKPLKKDGFRILVDRLWPRGISKDEIKIDDWEKMLAPSVSLRKWFGHDPELWPEFQKKYKAELKKNKAVDDFIEKFKDKHTLTLLYAAKDETHNHALVLKEYLEHYMQNEA